MIPIIDKKGKLLYEQIYEFYRDAILEKRLRHGERLPSYRALAKELQLGNNTVLKAYELLTLEGYVKNKDRKGLFVAQIDTRDWQIATEVKKKAKSRPVAKKPVFNPSMHLVDELHFPMKQWRKCSNWALDRISFQYPEHELHDPLKDQLVNYLYKYRGVKASAERLLIGSGASVLVFWLALVMRKTCSRIVIEDPGYTRIAFAFAELDYEVKPVRVGDDGIDMQKLSGQKADLVYLTPSHQYPTGAVMPVSNRLQILKWAKKNNAFIIEDDFDCEFRYKTRLMPSLQALDQSNRVIYVGTFSSALMPSLRVAYLVLPENFPVEWQSYTYLINTVPYFTRKALMHFMEAGFWERHLRKMRNVYRKKYDSCIAALRMIPDKHIRFNNAPSGLNILLHINTRLSVTEVVRRARENGIVIASVNEFYRDPSNRPQKPQVLFEFGSIPIDEIPSVVDVLYRAWFPKHN